MLPESNSVRHKTHYRRSQTLGYKGGIPVSKTVLIEHYPPEVEPSAMLFSERIDVESREVSIIGGMKPNEIKFKPTAKPCVPKYVLYDRCCLKFQGYYKDPLGESGQYSICKVELVYYLEDDTLTVMEPAKRASGLPQGKLVRRQKINKTADTYLHWADLNLAKDLEVFGRRFRLIDCDAWTREFLTSAGIEMNPPEDLPLQPQPDEFICKFGLGDPRIRSAPARGPIHRLKFRQFLDHDGQVLCFHCVWDRRSEPRLRYDDRLPKYLLRYFLADDTVEVRSLQPPRSAEFSGHPSEAILYRKQRLPKEPFPTITSPADAVEIQYYTPCDFHIGNCISVMRRSFILTECDEFTQDYYRKRFGCTDFSPFSIQA